MIDRISFEHKSTTVDCSHGLLDVFMAGWLHNALEDTFTEYVSVIEDPAPHVVVRNGSVKIWMPLALAEEIRSALDCWHQSVEHDKALADSEGR